MSPNVAIGVLTWRGEAATRRCLHGLIGLSAWPVPTIVVDNASGTHEAERLAAEVGAPVEALTRPVNDGVAGGYNAAIAWGADRGASHVLLLNNDIEFPDPRLLERLLAAADSPDVAAVAPIVLDSDGSIFSAGGVLGWATGRSDHWRNVRHTGPYPALWLDGPALLVSVDAVRRIGGLSPDFFMYWEDVDWGVRATAAGLRCLVEPSTRVVHARGARTSALHGRLQWRNRILFMRRNASLRDNLTSLGWLVSMSLPKALVHSLRTGTTAPLIRAVAAGITWNVGDAIRRRRWRLPADGPAVVR